LAYNDTAYKKAGENDILYFHLITANFPKTG
jgi:hypothetical protein